MSNHFSYGSENSSRRAARKLRGKRAKDPDADVLEWLESRPRCEYEVETPDGDEEPCDAPIQSFVGLMDDPPICSAHIEAYALDQE